MTKTALVLGVSGQDGAYLSELLLARDYHVIGGSRDAATVSPGGLEQLGIADDIEMRSVSMTDFRDLLQLVESTRPEEIYNLAGQSSVGLSFSQPRVAFESIMDAQVQLLEVIRHLGGGVKVYFAGSGECFGSIPFGSRSHERSPMAPGSPYAVAKAGALWMTSSYREAYGFHLSTGILFNHESPLRPARFVTSKIIKSAVDIASGSRVRLCLGNLDVWRDWGYAPEFVEAMWRMLQREQGGDYVIATGEAHSLKAFIAQAFQLLELNWEDFVDIDPALFRPHDLVCSTGDPVLAKAQLGWQARTDFRMLVQKLIDAELASRQTV